jgi:hypothetical protein
MPGWCAVSKNGRRRWPCLELALKLSPEQMKAVSARRPNVRSRLVRSQHEFLSIRTIATAKALQMHAAREAPQPRSAPKPVVSLHSELPWLIRVFQIS